MNPGAFLPMFGTAPHVPAICREQDANAPGAVDPRTGEVARPKKGQKQQSESGPCKTCGSRILIGSEFVCMSCHAVAPDVAPKIRRHALPAIGHDRTSVGAVKKARAVAKAARETAEMLGKARTKVEAGKAGRLTKKEMKALLADARRGEHQLPAVREFLQRQAA